ncbi:hypothetical protein KIW84_020947 [Lathyrus oleraceus]|uniref:Translocon-associated protein subunit alpha n=1 Tax=Pisum sativum TaxID=3888 RepID=A0A9D4Y740_PEA|nr:hypothetical protein KIW84_020947 [Pisum sativum]
MKLQRMLVKLNDIGIVGDETDDAQDFGDGGFPSAPGVDTICVFLKNIARLSSLNVIAIKASFPYIFSVSKFLQPGPFDLVGTIVYEMDQHPYQNTFFNGAIEVVEPGVLFSMEFALLFTLGTALLVLLGLWINGQIQNLKEPELLQPEEQP